jgi:hypothetical protein
MRNYGRSTAGAGVGATLMEAAFSMLGTCVPHVPFSHNKHGLYSLFDATVQHISEATVHFGSHCERARHLRDTCFVQSQLTWLVNFILEATVSMPGTCGATCHVQSQPPGLLYSILETTVRMPGTCVPHVTLCHDKLG